MELGKRIKQLRFKTTLTQEQLADRLGVVPQTVSKWENDVAMPDITTLPVLAEIFGVSIDDLFDLTTEQRLNRIENRMDIEEDLPQDVFREYEDYLKEELNDEQHKKRAGDLLAYLYWHMSNSYGRKASRYAKESVRMSPNEKGNNWILCKTDGYAIWDWNMANHTNAIEFYKELVKDNPEAGMAYSYLLDNLIADHRTDEAERVLEKYAKLKDTDPIHVEIYRANIELARYNEEKADRIINDLAENKDNFIYLFEAAQYYARKGDYDRAIELYELSFEKEPRRPRYQDELMAIADIYELCGNYRKAAETYDRIIDLLQNEWKLEEDTDIKQAQRKKAALLEKVQD